MSNEAKFDLAAAHEFFSASCFNEVWGLLDKAERTGREDQRMIELALASIWHWTQRADCTDANLSVGYWQASRVYAVLGLAGGALRYGTLSLDHGEGASPFHRGYAHEALARAASLVNDRKTVEHHLAEARAAAEAVTDEEARMMLLADLETIE